MSPVETAPASPQRDVSPGPQAATWDDLTGHSFGSPSAPRPAPHAVHFSPPPLPSAPSPSRGARGCQLILASYFSAFDLQVAVDLHALHAPAE